MIFSLAYMCLQRIGLRGIRVCCGVDVYFEQGD